MTSRGRRDRTFDVLGVLVRSCVDLSPLPEASGRPDLRVVEKGRLPSAGARNRSESLEIQVRDGSIDILWPGVALATLSRRGTVVVTPGPGAHPRWLRRLIVELVVPTWLLQRGSLVLHGSAVAYQGRAFGFLGFPGAGKSTLAAGLYLRGLSVVSDDILVIGLSEPRPVLRAGPPYIRLAADVYARWATSLPEPDPSSLAEGKAEILISPAPVKVYPLQGLGVIEDGPCASIEPVPARDATMEYLRHTRAIRWLGTLRPESHLAQCIRLASQIPMVRFIRPRDPADLDSWLDRVASLVKRRWGGG